MITLTDHAVRAVRALCADTGSEPTVRVTAVHGGRPAPVEVRAGATHRPGDLVVAAEGAVVLVDRQLAAPFDGHVLDADTGDDEDGSAPRFVLSAPGP